MKIVVIGASLALMSAASADAGTWAQNHPRRAEVNGRLANQNFRINRDYRDGQITAGQARSLHAEDHGIRTQERFDARFHNSHITAAQQKALNQDQNGVSRQIYGDAH